MGELKCKCPKGKYMLARCNATSDIVCQICPRRTFIDQENQMSQCRACRECSSTSNMEMVKECEADKNTECRCKPGYFCTHISESHCDYCSPVSMCPPGKGVDFHHTHLKDTVCRPCPEGTYSDVMDYFSTCKNHTSCDDLGRDVKVPGTSKSDVVCGNFKPCTTSCSWLLPASLWAGFVITALILFLILFIIYWRNKRQSKRLEISLSHISPVLPPDILKYPADCDVEKHAEHQQLTHLVGNYSDMDSSIQCDGFMPTMTMSEKYCLSAAANEFTDSIMCHSNCHSEPQESEWND
ncbi:tumor necrosis factor receptor superfamily member 5 isoform X1 [Carassius gibelio]|uniref:tumor necrosis factor receptor superfamily member 5 isoform X1 n=1 Tax=Carassius gibelio TaxID=101364 RepID=UPI002278B06B|nr:tumor necrosis factor receptor superfamily member 5 isoform X1 [Carassius gibelio]